MLSFILGISLTFNFIFIFIFFLILKFRKELIEYDKKINFNNGDDFWKSDTIHGQSL